MRIPKVLLNCKVAAAASVILMIAGTVVQSPEVRAWALLVGLFSAVLGIARAIRQATSAVKTYVRVWALETLETGLRKGIDLGREIEAAETVIAASRKRQS